MECSCCPGNYGVEYVVAQPFYIRLLEAQPAIYVTASVHVYHDRTRWLGQTRERACGTAIPGATGATFACPAPVGLYIPAKLFRSRQAPLEGDILLDHSLALDDPSSIKDPLLSREDSSSRYKPSQSPTAQTPTELRNRIGNRIRRLQTFHEPTILPFFSLEFKIYARNPVGLTVPVAVGESEQYPFDSLQSLPGWDPVTLYDLTRPGSGFERGGSGSGAREKSSPRVAGRLRFSYGLALTEHPCPALNSVCAVHVSHTHRLPHELKTPPPPPCRALDAAAAEGLDDGLFPTPADAIRETLRRHLAPPDRGDPLLISDAELARILRPRYRSINPNAVSATGPNPDREKDPEKEGVYEKNNLNWTQKVMAHIYGRPEYDFTPVVAHSRHHTHHLSRHSSVYPQE
ncbi:hypothetical protein GNI_127490 [Gregarina niphandrodes]|uniref:Uncharacterized protein n=1 Tax=Gregarina niphandrodes TaxID=110365 RepID=A0A023B1R9_GRENI|nr:hypothetical protein GNI_127490 [Gregarina niphandrodes]EZG49268.1 hypothetical protein GNI_127490 [Gregarina niphandrodes]|eukprot:XP_011132052.1 hypothetical protein GNI_127490 [Gregarina niphandrodes]